MEALSSFLSFLNDLAVGAGEALALLAERFSYVDYLFLLLCLTALIIVHLWFRNQHLSKQFEWLRENLVKLAGHVSEGAGANGEHSPAIAEIWVVIDRLQRNIQEIEGAFHNLLSEQTGLAQDLDRLMVERTQSLALAAPSPPPAMAPARAVPMIPPALRSAVPAPSAPEDQEKERESQRLRIENLEKGFNELRSEVVRLKIKLDLPRFGDPVASKAEVEQVAQRTELLGEAIERMERHSANLLERVGSLDNVVANLRSAIRDLKKAPPPKVEGLPELVNRLEKGYGDLQKARAEIDRLAGLDQRRGAMLKEALAQFIALEKEAS